MVRLQRTIGITLTLAFLLTRDTGPAHLVRDFDCLLVGTKVKLYRLNRTMISSILVHSLPETNSQCSIAPRRRGPRLRPAPWLN
jgi:hypothetical protein